MFADRLRMLNIIAKVIYIEVKRRGGRIEIASDAIHPLLVQSWNLHEERTRLVFTLGPSEVVCSSDRYGDRLLYRLDIAIKHLIKASIEQKLVVAKEDVETAKIDILFEDMLDGKGLALIVDSPDGMVGPNDRVLKIDDKKVVVVDGTPLPPDQKSN